MLDELTIETADGERLEAELYTPEWPDPTHAVLIAHPNPAMGGDMYTPVPSALFRALPHLGVAGLRFNFRGVGRSTGTHDRGGAEQLDISAALDCLADRFPTASLLVSGWSFGADLALTATHERVGGWLLVAAPLAVVDPDAMAAAAVAAPKRFVTGSHDHLAPPNVVNDTIETWTDATIDVVEGTDHFFGGHLDRVVSALADLVSKP